VKELWDARERLLASAARVPHERWAERPAPQYSPAGWHVGHVAATLARWLLPEEPGRLFDPFVTPKDQRGALPAPRELLDELDRVHQAARRGPALPGLPKDFLVRHLAQHALQHAEHLEVIAALLEDRLWAGAGGEPRPGPERVHFAGGEAQLGSDDLAEAYDNERQRHATRLAPFWIDRLPATVEQFAAFVDDGGYRDARHWSAEGWSWRASEGVEAPLGWTRERRPPPRLPVTGICWFEADAFARWRSARLPSEAEWEHAADYAPPYPGNANVDAARLGLTPAGSFPASPGGLCDMAGNVWEWTASWFDAYPGFRPYPYDGYSVPWFGRTHRVLRGGSWATAGRIARHTFRNWYEPHLRALPAGLRCAGDAR